MFGLIDAIEKFDLEKGVKLETYAIARIKGAIIDELPSIDWIPRGVRSKARDVEQPALLAEALNRMTEREKTVIVLYYYEGMTLAQIGQVLGVIESRVCQLHPKAVLGLRAKMAEPTLG